MRDKFICTKPGCGLTVYWHEDRCSSGHDVGFPNIREVSCTEEQDALQHRYENALQDAKTRGAIDTIQAFETALVSQSHCVINVWVRFLADFLNNDRILFSNYNLQVNAQVRRPTSMKDDRARRGVEGIILGSLAHNITYGALSLDGSGLISYGECAFTITDVTYDFR